MLKGQRGYLQRYGRLTQIYFSIFRQKLLMMTRSWSVLLTFTLFRMMEGALGYDNNNLQTEFRCQFLESPGLNIAFCMINKMPRLDTVPESTTNLNLGINCMLNLTHLVYSLKTVIREQVCQNKQNGRLTIPLLVQNMQKKVPTARNWSPPIRWQRTLQQI